MASRDEELIKLNIENLNKFRATLKKAADKVSDLSFAMGEIARDFYKSEKAIFQLKSPGGYPDLAESTKRQKKRLGVPLYPILKRSGKLEASVTSPSAPGSHLKIGKTFVEIGSTIPYANFHNSDLPRRKIPQRKFFFLGPESRQFGANRAFGGRPVRWKNIVEGYVKAELERLKKG
jgi:phage gpG-like protein